MKITIENTNKTVELNGVPAHIWEGQTSTGIKVHAFITRLAVMADQDQTQFQRELEETKAPSADLACYPLRMIL